MTWATARSSSPRSSSPTASRLYPSRLHGFWDAWDLPRFWVYPTGTGRAAVWIELSGHGHHEYELMKKTNIRCTNHNGPHDAKIFLHSLLFATWTGRGIN